MFNNETNKVKLKGLRAGLATAASLAALAMASHASAAQEIQITNIQMDMKYWADISGVGNVFSNGMTFTANTVPGGANVPDLFGFCIDVYHAVNLGPQALFYNDNQGAVPPLTTDFGGNALSSGQVDAMINLIDTGFKLHQNEAANGPGYDDTEMQLAAIQAAIWAVEVPSHTITVLAKNLTDDEYAQYQAYFTAYSTGAYTSLKDTNDQVFTLTDITQPSHQAFGIGSPMPGIPEPSTWAMMLAGFGGLGAMARRRRAVAVAA